MNNKSRVLVIPCCFAHDGLLNTSPYRCTITVSHISVANITLFIYSRAHEVSYLKSKAPYWCNVELCWCWYSHIYDITQSCYCLEPPVAFSARIHYCHPSKDVRHVKVRGRELCFSSESCQSLITF